MVFSSIDLSLGFLFPFLLRYRTLSFSRESAKRWPWILTELDTVRSGAEERTFWGARLDVLIFRLRFYHVLITYSAECNGPKFYRTLMFLGQAGMFLSFQARRSSATRSSTSDLTVVWSKTALQNHNLWACRLFFVEFNRKCPKSKFKQEDGCGMVLNSTERIRFSTAGRVRIDSGWSWTFRIACVTLHEGKVAPLTSQTVACAILFAVCLTVFVFEFLSRTFTIGLDRKKSIRSERMILECSFPLRYNQCYLELQTK